MGITVAEPCREINNLVHAILVLFAYTRTPPLYVHAEISSGARGNKFRLSLHLYPYYVYASNEGSGESVLLRRLI